MLIFIIILAFLPLLSLLQPGLPVTHDGQDHVARIASFYQSLSEGILVPRWAGNLNWGYGHPIFEFLYPLPSYFTSLIHFVGFSLVDSTKLFFAIAYVLSGYAIYTWIKIAWNKNAALLASVLYLFSPYRFVDMHVRGAIGEHAAFIFMPLVMLGLYKQSIIIIALSIGGLILSHNAVSLMFLPIILLYAMYNFYFLQKKSYVYIANVCIGILAGFSLSAFFWLPALVEGKYTLRDIVTAEDYANRFVPLHWFVYSPWNYGGGNQITKMLGVGNLIATCSVLFFWKKFTRKEKYFVVGSILFLIGSMYLMTAPSLWIWNSISIIQKFQFPWRLLTVCVFITSLFSIFVKNKFIAYSMVFLAVVTSVGMWKPVSFRMYDASFFSTSYPGTTDTGESSPIWSVRFMEQYPRAPYEIIDGNATVSILHRKSTLRVYHVVASVDSIFLENTLYFPGWKVFVDAVEVTPEFQNPQYRGLMTFPVHAGAHTVQIIYTDTKLRTIANMISIATIVTICVWQVYQWLLRRLMKKKI